MELDYKALLSYWRNSLSDSSRVASSERALDSAYEISIEEIRDGKVSKGLTDDFFLREENFGPDSLRGIPVLIFPYIYSARRMHGAAASYSSVKRVAPLVISAVLTRSGTLQRESEARPPIFLRDYLEPNAHSVSFGTLEDCDMFYSRNPFTDGTWEEAILYADELFLAVSGSPQSQFSLPQWERERFGRICEASDPVEARHILSLYNWLLTQPEPTTLSALRKGRASSREILSPSKEWRAGRLYRGHPISSFPLAPSQRRTLYHFISERGKDTCISVVNGPPGTGKTTLIQSMVAAEWVNAALNKDTCPIIFSSSTNNQAVTNINRAFDSVTLADNSALGGRWLSKVKSYGVYFASGSARVKMSATGTYFQLYSKLPTRDQPVEYFASFYETASGLAEGISEYIDRANRSGISSSHLTSLTAVQDALHHEMQRLDTELQSTITCISDLSKESGELPSLSAFYTVAQRLKESVDQAAVSLDAAVSEYTRWSALEEKWKRHQKVEPWRIWLMQFFAFGRTARLSRDYSFVRDCGLGEMFSHVEPKNLRSEITAYILEALATLSEEISHKRASLDAITEKSTSFVERLDIFTQWCTRHGIDGDSEGIHTVLDTHYRHTLFQLATHYWEGSYLQDVQALLDPSSGYNDGQSPEKLERHFRRVAKLAPCFISTLHMLPKWCRTYFREESYLSGIIDLLIIDEAAQVSPEIGVPVCALAKRVCTIGDCHQIEPVQLIPEPLDLVNVGKYLGKTTEAEIEELSQGGFLASSGSLLSLTYKAAPFSTHPHIAPGFFLTEHRRCLPDIISYCNELMYHGLLESKRPSEQLLHGLPQLGWMHCESRSTSKGGSHENVGEAEYIARWLSENVDRLRNTYKRPLKEIIAIITPFTAQAKLLKRYVARAGLGSEKITIGTLHSMQGAERPVIVFSPTYGVTHTGSVFFARNPRLLNVAVSRAQDSFLVIGSMELFRSLDHATGLLGKYLFADASHELSPLKEYTPMYVDAKRDPKVITSLSGHRQLLHDVISSAHSDVVIVSPFIAERALLADAIPSLIKNAVTRGVRVRIVIDSKLNRNSVALKKCSTLLTRAGAQVFLARAKGIHCKVICRDSNLIASGSFNWLAAVREVSDFQRFEVTFIQEGAQAAESIARVEEDLREILGHSKKYQQTA